MRVFAIFLGSYILLLVPGALLGYTYDRYALPILPALAIFSVLLTFQSQMRRLPWQHGPAYFSLRLMRWQRLTITSARYGHAYQPLRLWKNEPSRAAGFPPELSMTGGRNFKWRERSGRSSLATE